MPKSFISDSLESLSQAQGEFSKALRPGSILLVDSTFQGVAKQVQKGVAELTQRETSPEARSYVEDLKALGLPETSTDIYKQFFGLDLPWQTHQIQSSALPDLSSISLVILSGSPANVSFAEQSPDLELIPGLTHREALKRERAIIEAVFQRHIPLLGLCYGHQSVSHVLGGKVGRLPERVFGTWNTTPTSAGLEYLNKLGVNSSAFKNAVPAYHQDYVKLVPSQSMSLFQAENAVGTINYGSLHSEHQALTVQYHPEYLFIEPLLTAIRTEQPLNQPTSISSSIETLRLFTKFLASLA